MLEFKLILGHMQAQGQLRASMKEKNFSHNIGGQRSKIKVSAQPYFPHSLKSRITPYLFGCSLACGLYNFNLCLSICSTCPLFSSKVSCHSLY